MDQDFQNRGESLRQKYGIDGTAGDAQDVPHPFHADPGSRACLLCGLAKRYRKHVDVAGEGRA